jgi:putative Holliday junction resolvase
VPHPRTLALDVGDRRIGLAITDALGLTAQPLFTLHRTSLRADLKAVARFLRQHKVEVVVVGNPLNADGTASAQSAKAQAFAAELAAAHAGLQHHLLDERLTTHEANALLGTRASRTDRVAQKHLIDQVAAVLILEAFLSQSAGPALLPDPDAE